MRNTNQTQMHLGSRYVAKPELRLSLSAISYTDFPPLGETIESMS